ARIVAGERGQVDAGDRGQPGLADQDLTGQPHVLRLDRVRRLRRLRGDRHGGGPDRVPAPRRVTPRGPREGAGGRGRPRPPPAPAAAVPDRIRYAASVLGAGTVRTGSAGTRR